MITGALEEELTRLAGLLLPAPQARALLLRTPVAATLRPWAFRGPAVARQLAQLLGSPAVARACQEAAARLRLDEWEDAACRAVEELAGRDQAMRQPFRRGGPRARSR